MTFRLVEKEELEQLYLNVFCFFFSQTAHCYIHAAALVAEYLKRQGMLLTLTLEKKTIIYVPDFTLIYRIIESNR